MLMAAYAKRLDDWQEAVVDCWLGRDGDHYTMTSCGLSIPRQNGKNVCIEARELFGLLIEGEKIIHTAHQVKTAKGSFRSLSQVFEDDKHPEITSLVRRIRRTNGEEAIELKNGGVIQYSARSRQAARGLDGVSLVVFDEAQELTDDQIEAMLPTLAASATGNRQTIYTGTPPYPGCPGTVFRRFRSACLDNKQAAGDAWHEWSVKGNSIDDIDVTDTKLWYAANPALGIRITEDYVRDMELSKMSPDGFARERLCWWQPELSKAVDLAISAEAWDACASDRPKPDGLTAYGVKFSADGGEVCLCGAVVPKDGPARISLIDRKPMANGVRWLADWLNVRKDRAACVVIDGRNGVDLLVSMLGWRAKGSVLTPRARDVIAAATMLTDSVGERSLTWYKPQTALRESAVTATRRPISGGGGFGGENSAPIEAAAIALWGAKTTKRDPKRQMRIG